MSMRTCIEGFREPDETWRKMRAAYDACITGNQRAKGPGYPKSPRKGWADRAPRVGAL